MFRKDERIRIRLRGDAQDMTFECTVTAMREHGTHTWVEIKYTSDKKPVVGAVPINAIAFVQRLGVEESTS